MPFNGFSPETYDFLSFLCQALELEFKTGVCTDDWRIGLPFTAGVAVLD